MELHGISGGSGFSIGKLSSSLRYVTRNSSLKDKHATIMKVVRGAQGAIRSGKFNATSAMSKLKGEMSAEELKSISGVFKQLGSVPSAAGATEKSGPPKMTSLQKAVAAAEARRDKTIVRMNKLAPSLIKIKKSLAQNTVGERGRLNRTGLASSSNTSGNHYNAGANRGETMDKDMTSGGVAKPVTNVHMQF